MPKPQNLSASARVTHCFLSKTDYEDIIGFHYRRVQQGHRSPKLYLLVLGNDVLSPDLSEQSHKIQLWRVLSRLVNIRALSIPAHSCSFSNWLVTLFAQTCMFDWRVVENLVAQNFTWCGGVVCMWVTTTHKGIAFMPPPQTRGETTYQLVRMCGCQYGRNFKIITFLLCL